MAINVRRKKIRFQPDPNRFITRFYKPGDDQRARVLIKRVLELPEEDVNKMFNQVLQNFSRRHRNITRIFEMHFDNIRPLFDELDTAPDTLSLKRKLLVGAYFSMEYSIESVAFFNPSMVLDPDQTNLNNKGDKRIIVSFRATGEGHISSIVFRSGVIDADNNIQFIPPGSLVEVPETIQRHQYDKKVFLRKLKEMNIQQDVVDMVMTKLGSTFTYGELQKAIAECEQSGPLSFSGENMLQAINWVADSHYEITFSVDTAVSERVIYPISFTESSGIEDARFVRFVEDNGEVTYYATYTAFNGFAILPKLLETKDFFHFKISPIHGEYAQNRGMALFPRKVKGKYVMASRYDGMNNYIMFSEEINLWRNVTRLEIPSYPWEYVQMGNCGSPIETEKGWLMLTHGVGPMRNYCIGAALLDLDDPIRVIAHMKEPLMVPNVEERIGNVPNVLYSCGAMINNNELIIPYAIADTYSSFATVSLDELFDELFKSSVKPVKVAEPEARHSILVVDDEPIIRKFVTHLLNEEGYDVELASDGAEALLSIGAKRFDVILMDVNMPTLDGFQLMKIMKNKNIDTPVIVLSGDDKEDLESQGLQLDAVGFLNKPINPVLLLEKVKDLIE